MRQIINLPEPLKECVNTASRVWKYPQSVIIAYCVSKVFNHFQKTSFDDFPDELDIYYKYHILSLPRGKKSKEL